MYNVELHTILGTESVSLFRQRWKRDCSYVSFRRNKLIGCRRIKFNIQYFCSNRQGAILFSAVIEYFTHPLFEQIMLLKSAQINFSTIFMRATQEALQFYDCNPCRKAVIFTIIGLLEVTSTLTLQSQYGLPNLLVFNYLTTNNSYLMGH